MFINTDIVNGSHGEIFPYHSTYDTPTPMSVRSVGLGLLSCRMLTNRQGKAETRGGEERIDRGYFLVVSEPER